MVEVVLVFDLVVGIGVRLFNKVLLYTHSQSHLTYINKKTIRYTVRLAYNTLQLPFTFTGTWWNIVLHSLQIWP